MKNKLKAEKLKTLNVRVEKPFSAVEIFQKLKEEFLNGLTDKEKVYVFLHQMSELFTMLKNDADCKNALETMFKNNQEQIKHGFRWLWEEKRNFDFAAVNDPTWNTINEELEALKVQKSNREKVLKIEADVPVTYTRFGKLNPPLKKQEEKQHTMRKAA